MTVVSWTKWEERFMDRARYIAGWGKDPKHRVGAVIMDPFHRSIGEGFNGPPMFVQDNNLSEDELRMRSLHAELNAILHASKPDLKGCTMFVHPFCPCATCAGAIIQKQISEVIYSTAGHRLGSWEESQKVARQMFKEAGVIYRSYDGSIA